MRRRKWLCARPHRRASVLRNLDFVFDLRSEQHERTDGHGESRFKEPDSYPCEEMGTVPTSARTAAVWLWRGWRRRDEPTYGHASGDDFNCADKYGFAGRSGRPVEDDPGVHPGLLHRSCSTEYH